MNCPNCGGEMETGRVMIRGRIEYGYWADEQYFRKHPVNPSHRLSSSIEKEGGAALMIFNDGWNGGVLDEPPQGLYCRECGLLAVNAKGGKIVNS